LALGNRDVSPGRALLGPDGSETRPYMINGMSAEQFPLFAADAN